MRNINSKHFKNSRKKELNDFLNILSSYSISYKTADHRDDLPDHLWGYKIEEITFPVELSTLKHIRPSGFSDVNVIIDINVESKVNEWLNLNDPFTSLNFRSLLKGTNVVTNKTHYLSFHIDRHDSSTDTNEIHPLYHLQYLQNAKVKPKDKFDHGDSLQLDVPRMMHFPMELILGVSFLLSNFAPDIYTELIENRQYINLCKVYQERIWKPYIKSISDYWIPNANQWSWNPKENCPYLQ